MNALKLAGMAIFGSSGEQRGEITIYAFPVAFVVDKAGADNARALAARLLGAAEHLDPKGYRLEMPISDLAAPAEVERETEDLIERARRRT